MSDHDLILAQQAKLRKGDTSPPLRIRLHTVDSTSGEECTEDLTISALNAAAIAEALQEGYTATSGFCVPVTGISLHMAPSGRHGAWVGQITEEDGDETLLAGIVYLDFL